MDDYYVDKEKLKNSDSWKIWETFLESPEGKKILEGAIADMESSTLEGTIKAGERFFLDEATYKGMEFGS